MEDLKGKKKLALHGPSMATLTRYINEKEKVEQP